ADRVGECRVLQLVPLPLDDVQVGAAHTGAAHLDDDVQRAGQLGLRHLLDDGVLVVGVEPYRLHAASWVRCGWVGLFLTLAPDRAPINGRTRLSRERPAVRSRATPPGRARSFGPGPWTPRARSLRRRSHAIRRR